MFRRLTAFSLTLTFILVACGSDPTPLPTVSAPPVVKITPGVVVPTQPLAATATAAPTATPAVVMGPIRIRQGSIHSQVYLSHRRCKPACL